MNWGSPRGEQFDANHASLTSKPSSGCLSCRRSFPVQDDVCELLVATIHDHQRRTGSRSRTARRWDTSPRGAVHNMDSLQDARLLRESKAVLSVEADLGGGRTSAHSHCLVIGLKIGINEKHKEAEDEGSKLGLGTRPFVCLQSRVAESFIWEKNVWRWFSCWF